MPMIDVYAPADIFPAGADEKLGNELALAVLRAEGVAKPGALHLDNTAAFIHRLPTTAISTANTLSARNVRVQIVTPPGSLNREGQKQITAEATQIIARFAGDESLAARTWVTSPRSWATRLSTSRASVRNLYSPSSRPSLRTVCASAAASSSLPTL
ncbi:MAG TPA: hypothetical protein VGX23_05785 [Actinocrinis sp.]|nr:hypothetical protein [Actinocrinis sp.]